MPNQYNQFNNMGNKNYDINYNRTPNTDQMNNKNVENKIINNNLLNSDKKNDNDQKLKEHKNDI